MTKPTGKESGGQGPNSITMTYDLLVWVIPVLGQFPRDQKFLLGDRIENKLLDVLEGLIEAQSSRRKTGLLRQVNISIEILRFLFRLAHELRYLSTRRYAFVSERLDEIGRLVGGWLRKVAKP